MYLIWIYLNIPLCVVQKDLLAFLLPGKGPAIQNSAIINSMEYH